METAAPSVALPDRIFVTTDDGTFPLAPVGGVWEGAGVTVALPYEGQGLAVQLHAPGVAVRRLQLRWRYPVADGYLAFHADGQGDTQVIVNPQGPSTQIPITVTTLDHVDPSMIHSSDYLFA